MKKLIAMILIACMACMLIPAMADDAVTGDWYLKTLVSGGTEYDAAAMGYAMLITLNADGTASVNQGGETAEGTWTQEGDALTVTINDSPLTLTVGDGILTAVDGESSMIFSRDAVEAITVADVKAADSADAFIGSWTCAYVEADGSIVNVSVLPEDQAMPGLEIADGTLSFDAANEVGSMFNMFTPVTAFEDGKLTITSGLGDAIGLSGSVELLEDGMIKLTLSFGEDPITLYYAPAAAAEEPAA